jgi:outer membrane protein OmpA-like peptidoglycan-associated protein
VKKEDREKVDLAAKGIYYKSNSAEIDSLSYGNLNEIVNLMLARPELLLEIEGHTDNIGSEKANLKLSQARADACKNYFINTGIEESRISSIGYGDMMPIADNETEDGRAQNRRTVFELKVEEKK